MRATRLFVPAIAVALAGCGMVVPDLQEFWGTPKDASTKVELISAQVVCELRRAVQRVLWENKHRPVVFETEGAPTPPPRVQNLDWFLTWGAQVTLSLNIAESSGISPGVSFAKDITDGTFSTALGANLNSTATRNDKLNMFFTVADLANATDSKNLPCIPAEKANASLFIQSDLKLYDWLSGAMLPNVTNIISYQDSRNPANVIQHEIKFEIVSNGNVTPSWKLVKFSANTSGIFLSAGRDRTQDLTITFGPLADTSSAAAPPNGGRRQGAARSVHNLELATPAENAHLAAQVGLAVSQSLRGQ